MPDEHVSEPASEGLARRYFALAGEGDDPRVLEILHPEVEIALGKPGGARTLKGRDEVARFLVELPDAFGLYQPAAEVFHVVDEQRVVVEGRMRWMDEDRILRDDPMCWALEFLEGLLYRSTTARSVSEAHALLVAGPSR